MAQRYYCIDCALFRECEKTQYADDEACEDFELFDDDDFEVKEEPDPAEPGNE